MASTVLSKDTRFGLATSSLCGLRSAFALSPFLHLKQEYPHQPHEATAQDKLTGTMMTVARYNITSLAASTNNLLNLGPNKYNFIIIVSESPIHEFLGFLDTLFP